MEDKVAKFLNMDGRGGQKLGFRNTPLMHVIRSKYKSQFTMEFDMPDK